jgi:uroporphyrinogen-III synthase
MAQSTNKSSLQEEKHLTILITQAEPSSNKSPYFDVIDKHKVDLVFHPFIKTEGFSAKEFRRQKINILSYTSVIFTSRHAIDNFFSLCSEMKISVGQDMRYFCASESVALYLQKFILYRKRKVFYSADGATKGLLNVCNKHKEDQKFLYVCSETQQDGEIINWLKRFKNGNYALAFMYRTINNDVKSIMQKHKFDIVCFFTPSSVKTLLEFYPQFPKSKTVIGAFGVNTQKACTDAGFKPQIIAPSKEIPNMAVALDAYLTQQKTGSQKEVRKLESQEVKKKSESREDRKTRSRKTESKRKKS